MCDFNDDIFKNEIHTKTKYRHEALSRRRRYLKVLTLAFWYLSRRYLINVKSNATQTGPQTWASDPCRITWAVPPAEADSVRCHLKTIALFLSASCFKTNAMENNKNTYEHSNIGYEANEQYYVYATLFKLKASTTFTCHKEWAHSPKNHKANLINVPAMQPESAWLHAGTHVVYSKCTGSFINLMFKLPAQN